MSRGLVPSPLRLKRLGDEHLRLRRRRSRLKEFLRRTIGQLGVIAGCNVEHLGVARKFAIQQEERLDDRVNLVGTHPALGACHGRVIPKVLVSNLRDGFLQNRQRVRTAAPCGEVMPRSAAADGRFGHRGFLGNLGGRRARQKPADESREEEHKDTFNHRRTPHRRSTVTEDYIPIKGPMTGIQCEQNVSLPLGNWTKGLV